MDYWRQALWSTPGALERIRQDSILRPPASQAGALSTELRMLAPSRCVRSQQGDRRESNPRKPEPQSGAANQQPPRPQCPQPESNRHRLLEGQASSPLDHEGSARRPVRCAGPLALLVPLGPASATAEAPDAYPQESLRRVGGMGPALWPVASLLHRSEALLSCLPNLRSGPCDREPHLFWVPRRELCSASYGPGESNPRTAVVAVSPSERPFGEWVWMIWTQKSRPSHGW